MRERPEVQALVTSLIAEHRRTRNETCSQVSTRATSPCDQFRVTRLHLRNAGATEGLA
jgi:hypothetical protein